VKLFTPRRYAYDCAAFGLVAAALLSAALVCGCGGGDSGSAASGGKASAGVGNGTGDSASAGKGGGAGGGGAGGGGAGGGGAGGAPCNAVDNNAPVVPETMASGSLPEATGGLIPDGVFHLTSMSQYAGGSGPSTTTWKITFRIAGASMENVNWSSFSGAETRFTYDIATRDTQLLQTQTCPPIPFGPGLVGYTATPTTLDLIREDYRHVEHYTKE
jgi:hypothetical protein